MIATIFNVGDSLVIGLSGLILLSIMVGFDIRVLGFQFIAYYYLFYIIVFLIHQYSISINKLSCVLLSFVWIFLAWNWSMHGQPSWMPTITIIPKAIIQYAYRELTALIAIIILINIAPQIFNSDQGINGYIKKTGVYSLGMYVYHLIVCGNIVNCIVYLYPTISYPLLIASASIICFFISWEMVLLIDKNKISAMILLGKK